ncbi:MAG: twitching motility protein PilT [Deltaproteobacteria bacterium HGW-Deltaproteobacteria-23]|nr:MAG: twitching motility protein PilT [Deltaproteobacteria bacterium HGW-Deltaproteobacteria-23]
MNGKILVDTNIWVYAHLENQKDDKFKQASQIVRNPSGLVVSVQVLNEYYSVMLKNRADDGLIQANIQTILNSFEICWFSAELLKRSYALRNRYRYSCWDSLILAAALESGCDAIYTEDLQHGQIVETVKIINPFLLQPTP